MIECFPTSTKSLQSVKVTETSFAVPRGSTVRRFFFRIEERTKFSLEYLH